MKKVLLGLLLLGVTGVAFGQIGGPVQAPSAPEIDPGQATAAMALLSGAVMVIRGRLKK